ncbi:MAG: ferrous iron transport protein B [Deltaproteobacteria bacterium]|nr:ferrous iron transport protein B [Deltaproteobacteria bacterium]MBW2547306.1 ferrous iron transport protein B [Deltaproteobacteria bacterium]MBW2718336.1 ferrous iron transport protein B [Deltaproteobacteria bacterium]RLB44089.1 MAG: ferrous iron transport protein B [Deltaproteobacteria bacterium]
MSGNAAPAQVLIAGNPNCGKSTLFNALSGGSAHVGNYPGVTVDRTSARLRLGAQEIELVDVPGMYSLTAGSPEEQLAVDALLEGETRAVICVVDATTLQRGLYLALQLTESGIPVVVALNMMDSAESLGLQIDTERLSQLFGAPVLPVVATKRRGLDALLAALDEELGRGSSAKRAELVYPPELEADVAKLVPVVAKWRPETAPSQLRVFALWCLLSLGEDHLRGIPDDVRRAVQEIRQAARALGRNIDLEIISSRYAWLDDALGEACSAQDRGPSWSERIDRVLTHPVAGLVVFAAVMLGIFEALFAGAEPLIAAIESFTGLIQAQAAVVLPAGVLQDLVVEGIIAGVGNVIVFAPQILILFLFVGFLEDSGYLARVAFVIDRVMKGVGLHGKAFVPLLSGFACAIPAVMATRTIERRRDRLVTMLALPLMSCSARLPVYILVVGTVFAGQSLGWFSAGAVALFSMYTLSVLVTLAAAAVIGRTVLPGPAPTFVLEMPPYRWPSAQILWLNAWRRLRVFLVDAGTIILAMTILLWALLSFPKSADITEHYAAERERLEQTEAPEIDMAQALRSLDSQEAAEQLGYSFGGRFGHAIEPALRPIGFDWQIGVGIIGAFAAREVFISTLGVVFGIGEADEENTPLRQALRDARHADGTPVMTPLSGISLMVFFLLACQCMSTLAVVRRESGSWKWPVFLFSYMTVLAYMASLAVYQGGQLLGFG